MAIIGAIGLNLFRTYFSLIAQKEVDFPRARASGPIHTSLTQKGVPSEEGDKATSTNVS